MTILYLYSELGAYNFPVFRELVASYGAHIHVVHWEPHCLRPLQRPLIDQVHYYSRSEFTGRDIFELALSVTPDIVYISGWMDKGYLPTAKMLKDKGVPVVIGFDDQWRGTLRQWVGSLFFRVYLMRFYSNAWVAGPRQYEFARRLGFKHRNIIYGLLTCDSGLFRVAGGHLSEKKSNYPRCFLYVGKFLPIKGFDILAKAFSKYRDEYKGDWKLICVGSGELQHLLIGQVNIEMHNFMEQAQLVQFCERAGVFVLPSRLDQWGVVVHEFATAGLPLLLSEYVGAKDTFFIEGFNGMSFANNSSDCLAQRMLAMSKMSAEELYAMGENSRRLASRIDPSISAANLMSVIMKDTEDF